MPPKGATAATGAPAAQPKTVKRYVARCDVPAPNDDRGLVSFGPCPWNERADPVLHDSAGKAWREATIHARDAGHLRVDEHEYIVERKVSVKLTLLKGKDDA